MLNALDSDPVDQFLRTAPAGAIVHLVGAGGCGMSGLGHLLLDLGFDVTGSDLVLNEEVRQLQTRGARIHSGHSSGHMDSATVLLAYTSAVRQDNPELQWAIHHGIPVVRRAVLLAALLHRQCGVCIAGMHGKTTTTALLTFALEQLGSQPSYAIGALVPQLPRHARFVPSRPAGMRLASGGDRLFLIEADESDGTLNQFRPRHAVLLNIDSDHLDHFGNMEAITAEFADFAERVEGLLVFCADDPRLAQLLARKPRAISYGRHPLATYRAELCPERSAELSTPPGARLCSPARFQVWHQGALLGWFETALFGEQNISNATAAIALLHELGFAPAAIARAIAPFRGAARRQQELYSDERCRVFEDYGHHPNEIRVTLRALRSLGAKRLLVAFQPHRFTRTQHLWREFATCFGDADRLWLAEVYSASEPEIPGINSGFLASAIQTQGQAVEAVVSLGHLGAVIQQALQPGDLVVFLGAGDITQVAHDLADQLRHTRSGMELSGTALAAAHARSGSLPSSMKAELHAALAARLSRDSIVRLDEPLARKTTLRVGGAADLYVEPGTESDLAEVLRFCAAQPVPLFILGRGSNLLIRDGGIRGVVVCLAQPHFSQIAVADEKLRCGAGARLKAVAVQARRHGLTGLEFLEGIPGSVGGAMRMNAGAMGCWLFDVVDTIRFMDRLGVAHERRASEVHVEYRGCPLFKDHLALEAVLRGHSASREAIQSRMESFNRKRWESQPAQPSAGCIFKNPGTIGAGRLIDELGLKGCRVGGAMVSDVHANFIVNDGTATAEDVLSLIEVIKDRVRTARGIELEPEVQILGEG